MWPIRRMMPEPRLACCLQSDGAARGGSLLQCACVSAGLRTPHVSAAASLFSSYLLLKIKHSIESSFNNFNLSWINFKGQIQEEYNGNVAATGFRWFSAHVVVNLHSYLIAGTLRESEWWRFCWIVLFKALCVWYQVMLTDMDALCLDGCIPFRGSLAGGLPCHSTYCLSVCFQEIGCSVFIWVLITLLILE